MSTLAVKETTSSPSSSSIGTAVIVPLYIYPNPGAWDSLYAAIKANPSQMFNVIVNPNSGPGAEKYPDPNYIAGLQRLKSFPSVKTIGYVHMTYGSRNIKDVEKDIDTYVGWAAYSKTKPITVDGIFIDEAPSEYGTRNRNLNSRDPSKGQDPYDGFGTFFAEFVKAMDDANVSFRYNLR